MPEKLSDVALVTKYADQSHFIRSFKEFAGVSPFGSVKKAPEVMENFAAINR